MVVKDLYTDEVLAQFGTDTTEVLYTTKAEWEESKKIIEQQQELNRLKAERNGKIY